MAHLASFDPATGDELGRVQEAGPATVQDAFEEARRAQRAWAATPVSERTRVIRCIRRAIARQGESLAAAVTAESGKPIVEAWMADVLPAADQARFLERRGPTILADRRVALGNVLLWDRRSRVGRRPAGVVGIIAPWNYPLAIPAAGVLPALLAGNGVVLKPSEKTPLVGDRLIALMADAGVPAGLISVVHGRSRTGAEVAAQADAVLFTGSAATGRKVAATAAKRLVPCSLELGGKDPMVVLPDARRGLAVAGAAWGAFTNAGQTCASIERAYVVGAEAEFTADVADAARRLRVGPGAADVDMGPLIDGDAVRRVRNHIRDAEHKGARVECGGEVRDDLGPLFMAPTVLSGVDHDMLVMRDETFGPVLPVMTARDDSHAVALANDSEYGLTASVWGRDRRRVAAVAHRLDAGTVTLNDHVYSFAAAAAPWGGIKASGLGTSHGRWGLEAVTRLRHTAVASGLRRRSAWYFPYDENLRHLLDHAVAALYGGRPARLARVPAPYLRRL